MSMSVSMLLEGAGQGGLCVSMSVSMSVSMLLEGAGQGWSLHVYVCVHVGGFVFELRSLVSRS